MAKKFTKTIFLGLIQGRPRS